MECGDAEARVVEAACTERCRRLLRPFAVRAWQSDAIGLLTIAGDPCEGQLEVASCCGEPAVPSEIPGLRTLRVDGKGIVLEGLSSLRLVGCESHVKERAVWKGPRGEREVWLPRSPHASRAGGSAIPSAQRTLDETHEAQPTVTSVEAAGHCIAATEREQLHAEALPVCAQAYVVLQDEQSALDDAHRAVSLDPNNHVGHQMLGYAKFAAGDFAGARESFRTALRLGPDDTTIDREKLFEAERQMLRNQFMPDLRRTFDVRDWHLRDIWELCCSSAMPSVPCAFRQFALLFQATVQSGMQMPYLLTVPAMLNCSHTQHCRSGTAPATRYPLIVYLHSAASTDICKGNILLRQLQFVAQEAPHAVFVERGEPGLVDRFIGLAPCCPPNLAAIANDTPKSLKRRKVFWFKSCETFAYSDWDFTRAVRCFEVELLVTELLAHVCENLPVDSTRIYFVGSSCGGYAVFRLGELVPELPAAIVPMAGYYPEIPGQDHDQAMMVDRLRGINIWPMHCEQDKLCRPDLPHVERLYRLLKERNGVQVEWVPGNIAKGSRSNFHSAHQRIFANPDAFYYQLGQLTRPAMNDAVMYLRRRLAELQPAPLPYCDRTIGWA
mmetsp:Transcript_35596/g.82665  ORF Transcript_35596/g.82665 Transcript_35596/m.82665 type:complete len:610 (-) Transcript_35596:63-1892(-)